MLEGDRLLTAMAYNIMKMHRSTFKFCSLSLANKEHYLNDHKSQNFLNKNKIFRKVSEKSEIFCILDVAFITFTVSISLRIVITFRGDTAFRKCL